MDEALNVFIDGQRRMLRLGDEIKSTLRKITLKHYPEIENLEKEGFVKLVNYERRMINEYVAEVNDICYSMQIGE